GRRRGAPRDSWPSLDLQQAGGREAQCERRRIRLEAVERGLVLLAEQLRSLVGRAALAQHGPEPAARLVQPVIAIALQVEQHRPAVTLRRYYGGPRTQTSTGHEYVSRSCAPLPQSDHWTSPFMRC